MNNAMANPFRPMQRTPNPPNIPMMQNMPFHPSFQGSPPGQGPGQQIMIDNPVTRLQQGGMGMPIVQGANFTSEQLQNLMIAQQRYMANRNVGNSDNQLQFINSTMGPRPIGNGAGAQVPQRNQIQADLSTAAAFVALQNAQKSVKEETVCKS
jgi:hypothetical protein